MRRRNSTAGGGGRVYVKMKDEGGRMKARLNSISFILPPSSFRLPVARPLALAVLLTFCLNVSAQTSWKKQQTGTFAWLHSVFFVDESRGWAVGGKGALLSTADGGEHWEQRRRPAEDT